MNQAPNLFLGYGRLVKKALQRSFFERWYTLSASQNEATYQGDFLSFSADDFPAFETVIFALAPLGRDQEHYKKVYRDCLVHALSILKFKKFIFCGSTAVYPSLGPIVSEEVIDDCTDDPHADFFYRLEILRQAEKILYHQAFSRSIILRFSGLFDATAQHSVYKSNRISLADAAYFLEKAVQDDAKGYQVYHISDPRYLKNVSALGKEIYPLKTFAQWGKGPCCD